MAFAAAAQGLSIDSEFKALIPPLQPEELSQLEDNLKEHGCRDALTYWPSEGKRILLDGHNRLALCNKNKIPFKQQAIKLASRAHARVWILFNQLGRRNLPEDVRALLALRAYKEQAALSRKGRAKQAADVRWGKAVAKGDTGKDSLADVAKLAGVSAKKLRWLGEVERRDTSGQLLGRIERGELSLADAKREVREAVLVAKLEAPDILKAKRLQGKYDVIVCDPPWPGTGRRDMIDNVDYPERQQPYAAMQINQLEIVLRDAFERHTASDCHVFLWVSQEFVGVALAMLEQYGLVYKQVFAWMRPNIQPNELKLASNNLELALYAQKGRPEFVTTKDFVTGFAAPIEKLGGRPAVFYENLVRVTRGRRLDMFERRKIAGFEGWGKAAPKQVKRRKVKKLAGRKAA